MITVAQGRFAPGHLGELTQFVPFEMVDHALADTGTVQARLRDLPSPVVVYLLLAGSLFAEVGYVGVWGGWCPVWTAWRWPRRPPRHCARPVDGSG